LYELRQFQGVFLIRRNLSNCVTVESK